MSTFESRSAAHNRFMVAMDRARFAFTAAESYAHYCEAIAALNACAAGPTKPGTMGALFYLMNKARREMRRESRLAA